MKTNLISKHIFFVCVALFSLTSTFFYGQTEPWEILFNGKDFKNFEQLNGNAKYLIEDGQMIGISKLNTPNSFLATKKKYGDFILEFEVKVDLGLNSGVQFRSNSFPEFKNGRVHGYQCEIETSSRKWAGGIYDEARRGWLYPLTRNDVGQNAFINGAWNHYRIEAYGNEIRTFINGVMCTNLVDSETSEGFIAFQVHSINNEEDEGKTVRWRNIRILTDEVDQYRLPVANYAPEISYLHNELTQSEQRRGWRLLWDGTSTNGWRSAKSNQFPAKGWSMKNGVLSVEASDGSEAGNGGDIITTDLFADFELSVDFKLTEGANSGIKYFIDPELIRSNGNGIGLEFQILDDKKHPDAKQGKNGNRTVGSLYDLIRAESTSAGGRGKNFKGINEWNNARIVVRNGEVEHWLNHVKVVSFNRYSQPFKALVEKSKYEKWKDFGIIPEGHILIQDHGDQVSFKNIKVREY